MEVSIWYTCYRLLGSSIWMLLNATLFRRGKNLADRCIFSRPDSSILRIAVAAAQATGRHSSPTHGHGLKTQARPGVFQGRAVKEKKDQLSQYSDINKV
jgi:hypothetical protein